LGIGHYTIQIDNISGEGEYGIDSMIKEMEGIKKANEAKKKKKD